MALNNFFKINLPYGIKRNGNGHWAALNREYRPLGGNNFIKHVPGSAFIYTNYGELSDKLPMDLRPFKHRLEIGLAGQVHKFWNAYRTCPLRCQP